MTRHPAILPADDPDAIAAAVEALRAGELVALPTETVYGVACTLDADAIERLLTAKGREVAKGITLGIDTIEQADGVSVLPPAARRLAARFWPGPLTIVVPERPEAALPFALTGGGSSVGLRLPDHPVPRALARAVGPLPLTSANRSGEPDARTAADAASALGDTVRIVLDGGPARGGVPSTVVAVDPEGSVRVLREGALPPDAILAAAHDG